MINKYYEMNDGWFTYYVNTHTGENEIKLHDTLCELENIIHYIKGGK